MSVVQEANNWKRVEFTPQKREALRKSYKQAVKEGKESFVFEGDEYLTRYAKYVLEYLDMKSPHRRNQWTMKRNSR